MKLLRLGLFIASVGLAVSGCPGCPPPTTDGGTDPDGGGDGDGDPDGGEGPDDGGVSAPVDGGPVCDENTEGFGDPCAAQEGDPECGNLLCCTPDNPLCEEGQIFFCYDLGPNDCGGCGELDTSAGRIGEGCGEYGCGTVACNEEGTATICEGDHPRNVCDGCAEIEEGLEPGDICSTCQTGQQVCTRDDDSLVCWRGREPDNECGGCDRCILYHAYMDERLGGGYIRTGTLALIESVGDGEVQLVFDPLIEGAGTNGLPRAQLVLNDTQDIMGFPTPLSPFFAEALTGLLADPVRSYSIPASIDLASFEYLVLYDYFLNTTISAGELIPGPPPGYVEPPLDGGPLPGDAGPLDGGPLDGGPLPPLDGGLLDAGPLPPFDGGPLPPFDGGLLDGGLLPPLDGGLLDAGPAPADAGGAPTDAGAPADAGTTDAGL